MSRRKLFESDPLLDRQYRAILDGPGAAAYARSSLLTMILGVIEGAALLAMVPASISLGTQQATWGLPIEGWLAVLALFALIAVVTTYGQERSSYLTALHLIRTLHARIGRQLMRLPLGWFGPQRTGKLSKLVTDGVMAIGQGIAHFRAPIIRNGMASIIVAAGMWFIDVRLGVAFLAVVPVIVAFAFTALAVEGHAKALVAPSNAEVANRIVEFAAAQPVIRAAGRAHSYTPLDAALRDNARAQHAGLWWGVLAQALNGLGLQAVIVVMIMWATRLGGAGSMPPVTTIVVIGVILRYTRNIQDLQAYFLSTQTTRAEIATLNEVLQATPMPEPEPGREVVRAGAIEFNDVTFSYGEREVLRGVSLSIQPRTLTAIVGPSGSGKTTIFRLISRFWDVDGGSVKVGGVDVREQRQRTLMEQLSMVFQDVYLYDATLKDNIRVGCPEASEEDVRAAASMAGVDDIARRLPHGWATPVGERGGKLSGGERQRVSIARALVKNAPIVLFDEATSALDPENEQNISRVIDQLREEATVVVIAHKLATVQRADAIIVLDGKGAVSAVGTHEELLAAGGIYASFWNARRNAAGWQIASGDGR